MPGVRGWAVAETVNFQEGGGGWDRVSFIVRSRLEAEPPGVPVDGLSLTLSGFTGELGALSGLSGQRVRAGEESAGSGRA